MKIKFLFFAVSFLLTLILRAQSVTFAYGQSPEFFIPGNFIKMRIGADIGKKTQIGLQFLNVNYQFYYTQNVTGAHYFHPDIPVLFEDKEFKRGIYNTGGIDGNKPLKRNAEIYHHIDFFISYSIYNYKSFRSNLILSSGLVLEKNQYFSIFGQGARYTFSKGDIPVYKPFADKEITNSLGFDLGTTAQFGYDVFRNLTLGLDVSLIFYSKLDAGHFLPSFFIKYNFNKL